MTPVTVQAGDGPVILGLPHCGTYVPDAIWDTLNETGRQLADTDWHIDRLYDGLLEGVTTVRANAHRYVIDVNRDPNGVSLYPGQNTTTLVPLTDFDGRPIWNTAPDSDAIADRLARFHAPYHAALQTEIDRVRARHGVAILYDCHSIRSHIPFLFDGTLPDFNIGTNNGTTCSPAIGAATTRICAQAAPFSHVVNGRFKGGWTTRHYAVPGVESIQMELAQSTYLAAESPPWRYDASKADRLRPYLAEILHTLADLAPTLAHSHGGTT
ncbi:N-formylglutamate deformylase [Thalassorhabdomicrobium marinisediminis]|uniref:N-formylglutamate deformylase n=1 Tax=Thalassorhabdomicrobium marinisediminis TaxID=2170577 RepID=A0A2T7G160_9RHOB|nr:N-formylglutamate deformylase [Thalassorhabdomicrobium marinisediminis]PVA08149.1 N-formylglutamate deformylase [Thalassorhabdomicrobium marinisediminis]